MTKDAMVTTLENGVTFAEIDPLGEVEGGPIVFDHGRNPAVRVQHPSHLQEKRGNQMVSQTGNKSTNQPTNQSINQ